MDLQNTDLASGLVSSTYIQQGADALSTRRRLIKTLLSQRCLPKVGWDEDTVELFIKVCQGHFIPFFFSPLNVAYMHSSKNP